MTMLADTQTTTARAADAAVADAKQAMRTADAAHESPSRIVARHEAGLAKLSTLKLTARSAALQRLISEGIELFEQEFDLGSAHSQADDEASDARQAGSFQAAGLREAERAAEAAWQAKRAELEAKALEVAAAPFADHRDLLIRADACAWLIGVNPATGLPDCDEDIIAVHQSLRKGIEEIVARGPDREPLDQARADLEKVERDLTTANDEHERRHGSQSPVVGYEGSELQERLSKLCAERERLRSLILSLEPGDVGDLLLQMEIIFDHVGVVDVTTYSRRASVIGETELGEPRPVLESELWTDDDSARRRALALLAANAAKLRDRELPRDWAGLMRDGAKLHPNARDVIRLAYDKGLDAAGLSDICLSSANTAEDRLPVLLFTRPWKDDCWVTVSPGAAWEGRPVPRGSGETVQ